MLRLFLVKTMMPTSSGYNTCYVVSENCNEAWLRVKEQLEKTDCGFSKDRQLDSVTLIAEDYDYTRKTRLFL